jgi:hypothetical protein
MEEQPAMEAVQGYADAAFVAGWNLNSRPGDISAR